jgi:glycosyltransferase involved in cell wall biosynthesis
MNTFFIRDFFIFQKKCFTLHTNCFDMEYKISVIVPVYNVENYIERCAGSLFEQTLKDGVEYIFVNDCTPDRSMQVLEEVVSEYPDRQQHVRYVNHSSNSGAPASRNSGLAVAQGEYVFLADADDWAERKMLEDMYRIAKEQDAEIVRCDFFCAGATYEEISKQGNATDPIECIKLLLSEKIHGAFWNKLIRRSLFTDNEIVVFDGYWDDLRASVELFYYAKKIAYIPNAYYHYIQYNPHALSIQNYERKLNEMIIHTNGIIAFLQERNVYLDKYFNYLKLGAKRGLLFTSDKKSFQRWRQIYPEANKYMWNYPVLPFHLRIVGGCISILPWPLIDLWVLVKKMAQRKH